MQSQQELSKLSTNNEIKDNFKFSNLTDDRIDIPNELKKLNQWVTWKPETRKNGKTAKTPYTGNGKTKASITNPDHWAKWDEIKRFDNKGFVFTDNDPYAFAFIDIDDCIDESGKVAEWASKVIQHFDTYTEYSPSRKGFHLICKAKKNGNSCRKKKIEIYDSKRYATMTGNVFESYNIINDRQDALNKLYKKLFKENENKKHLESTSSDMSDEKIMEFASKAENGEKSKALYNGNARGYESNSEADLALCSILAFYTGNNPDQIDRIFRGSGLYRSKWDRDDYRTETIAKAIGNTNECYRSPNSENEAAGDTKAQDGNKQREKFKYPKPIPLTEIMQKEFEPRKDVIRDLIPSGLTLAMSAEKIGKSSMFRQVGYSVATGQKCLGESFSPAVSGHVLYLSFEDDDHSIQESMELFCQDSAPPNYQFQYKWLRMGKGCIRALESYVNDFPYTKLIIIDTWSYIRRKDEGNISFGRYNEDVEDLNKLKVFANKHNLSIMISTHTGKAKHDDWTRNVHGGVGQTATADTIIYIDRQRGQSQGHFHITGKRIREKSLVAEFQHRSWVLQEYSDYYNLTPTVQEYWDVFAEYQNKPMNPKEVLNKLYPDLDEDERLRKYDAVRQQLMRMGKSKKLQKVERSYYRIFPKEFKGYKKIKAFESQCYGEKV